LQHSDESRGRLGIGRFGKSLDPGAPFDAEHAKLCTLLLWSFFQSLQPAQLSFIDPLQVVIGLGLWHVGVLLALGL
jgi:hypothetical protein